MYVYKICSTHIVNGTVGIISSEPWCKDDLHPFKQDAKDMIDHKLNKDQNTSKLKTLNFVEHHKFWKCANLNKKVSKFENE